MPQMAPTLWTNMLITMMVLLLITLIITYFFKNFCKTPMMSKNIGLKNKKLLW